MRLSGNEQCLQVVGPAHERPDRRVDEREECETEQEEHAVGRDQSDRETARRQAGLTGAEDRPGDLVLEREHEHHRDRDRDVLGQTRATDPDHLADQQLARRGCADHQLHDPTALLGGDTGRDPHAVDEDRDEHQDDEHGPEEAAARDDDRVDLTSAFGRGDQGLRREGRRPERPELRSLGQRGGPIEDAQAIAQRTRRAGCGPRLPAPAFGT
jgi:hypothetical protein